MATFYVLTPPVLKNPEKDTLFIRDGFSWPAFFFPLFWLLFKKMWLVGGLAVIFYLTSILIAERWGLDGLPLAFSFILSLWTALEGNHVRARMLQRRGWTLRAEIAAHDLEEAEEIYFAGENTVIHTPAPRSSSGHLSHGAVALGLIGPYGDR